MERLKQLLSECPYRGAEYEEENEDDSGCGQAHTGLGVMAEDSVPMEFEGGEKLRKREAKPKKVIKVVAFFFS